MQEILAKSNGETLLEHTKKVINGIKKLESLLKEKINIEEEFWKYLKFAGLIHDFGKVYDGFQNLLKHKTSSDELAYIHSLLSPVFIKWYEIIEDENWLKVVLSAIVFHHYRGKINNIVFGNSDEEILLSINLNIETYLIKLKKILQEIDPNLTNILLEKKENSLKSFRFFNFLLPPVNIQFLPEFKQRITEFRKTGFDNEWIKKYIFFKGLLMRADHFASTGEKIEKIEQKPLNYALIQQNIVNTIHIKMESLWQYKKLKTLKKKNLVLIGSTGIGKTEFAFLWGAGEKIIFTLPMRTMVDQTFQRAVNIFKKENTGILHGTTEVSLLNMKDKKMDFEVTKVKLLSKEFSYPLIITTGDQTFPVALKYPGYEKLMSILGYSHLVIDEVQSYDPVASAIIVKTIEETFKLGGKFLLMTATLPEYIEIEIENRIGKENFEKLEVYSKNGGSDIIRHKIYIENTKKPGTKNVDDFLEFISDKIKISSFAGKYILIIVNTVKNAQELYQKLKEKLKLNKDEIILLHSRFISEDREEKIEKVTSDKEKPKILITTQIVEASIDIDYDILITELAPLDSLIQRMGRVNRNRREYRKGIGDIYIWPHYLVGSEYVYKKELLEHTCNILKMYNALEISEKKKQKILKEYYDKDNKAVKSIIDEFERNLWILDNLYTASSKREAEHIFRDIKSINIVPKNKIEILKKEIDNSEFPLFAFVKLMKYSITKPYRWGESLISLKSIIKNKNLSNFLDDYYLSIDEYNSEIGLNCKYIDEKELTSPVYKNEIII